jgi:hypothetical protein
LTTIEIEGRFFRIGKNLGWDYKVFGEICSLVKIDIEDATAAKPLFICLDDHCHWLSEEGFWAIGLVDG